MKPVFNITMRCRNQASPITEITVRVEGLERNNAIFLAEANYPEFEVKFVIAGPRNEVS